MATPRKPKLGDTVPGGALTFPPEFRTPSTGPAGAVAMLLSTSGGRLFISVNGARLPIPSARALGAWLAYAAQYASAFDDAAAEWEDQNTPTVPGCDTCMAHPSRCKCPGVAAQRSLMQTQFDDAGRALTRKEEAARKRKLAKARKAYAAKKAANRVK